MANTPKPKAQSAARGRKRPARAKQEPAIKPDWNSLTPHRVRQIWEIAHPGRPEVRSMLERLYRRRY